MFESEITKRWANGGHMQPMVLISHRLPNIRCMAYLLFIIMLNLRTERMETRRTQ